MRINCWTFLLLLFSILSAQSQILIQKDIDIGAGIKDSSIQYTIAPASANPARAFDGNSFTELAIQNSDTLIITLHFTQPQQINRSRVFFWNNGKWLLEAAENESELNTKTGSYVLLNDSAAFTSFAWDSVSFVKRLITFIRLSARNLETNTIMLGEWNLQSTQSLVKLVILPDPPRIIPNASLQLKAKMLDDLNRVHDFPKGEAVNWKIQDPSIASTDLNGKLTGLKLGSTEITANNDAQTLTGKATVNVVTDFRSQKVQPMTVKVALVLPDPIVQGGQRLHEKYKWRDPLVLANRLIFHFREATESVVNFKFVQIIYTDSMFCRYNGGNILRVSDYIYLYSKGDLQKPDSSKFDYRELVNHYGFDEKRNKGEIDEVWVFSPPYTGMYESQLLGPNAFWWNSPPINDGTNLKKLLSVMGLNYERGVDQAFHSFGHRTESAVRYAYEKVQGRDWNSQSSDPTPWDLFTRYDKITPAKAHCGNVHFPPNGTSDYNYGNTTKVISYADNWLRYPYLFDQTRLVNVSEWYYADGEPLAEGNDHLGFLRWWYGHLPRYVGVTDGILNNWWHYAIDFEAAMELAKSTPVVRVDERKKNFNSSALSLDQNFPNPITTNTVNATIKFYIPRRSNVTLRIYDLLGREVGTLVNEELDAGDYIRTWNAVDQKSGLYFYKLQTEAGSVTKKIVVVK